MGKKGQVERNNGRSKDFGMKLSVLNTFVNRYFVYFDMAGLFLAFSISYIFLPYLIPYLSPFPEVAYPPIRYFASVLIFFAPVCFFFLKLERVYENITFWSYLKIIGKMAKITILSLAFAVMIMFLAKETQMSRLFMVLLSFCFLILLSLSRFILRWLIIRKEVHGDFQEKVILIGDRISVVNCLQYLLPKEREPFIKAVGYVSTDKAEKGMPLPHLGFLEDLKGILNEMPVAQVILIITKMNSDCFPKILEICEQTGINLRVINEYFFNKNPLSRYVWRSDFFAGVPSVYATEVNWTTEKEIIKRIFDISFSSIILLIVSPMLGLISLMIKVSSPGPVFFRRQVMGQHGREFVALKFRSMVENAHELLQTDDNLRAEYQNSLKIKNDPRVTPIGKFLRNTKLDEFPQFINVFRGEMSVVGPRMLGDLEWAKYGDLKAKVLSVKPGITGFWQVNGDHDVTFEERVQYDLQYINNYNLSMDLLIVLKTILTLFGVKWVARSNEILLRNRRKK